MKTAVYPKDETNSLTAVRKKKLTNVNTYQLAVFALKISVTSLSQGPHLNKGRQK
jgi:hypothetical protein